MKSKFTYAFWPVLFLCCAVSILPCRAEKWVRVSYGGDKEVFIQLSDEPSARIQGNGVVITSLKPDVNIEIALSGSPVFEIVDHAGIEDQTAQNVPFVIYAHGNVEVYNLQPNEQLRLFNVSGMLLDTFRANHGGDASFAASSYPAGVYLLKSHSLTFKIIIK